MEDRMDHYSVVVLMQLKGSDLVVEHQIVVLGFGRFGQTLALGAASKFHVILGGTWRFFCGGK